MATMSHRKLYPEQYSHPLVGLTVETPSGEHFVVERVIHSPRWGYLAILSGTAAAYSTKMLKVVKDVR